MKEHIFLHLDLNNQGDKGGAMVLEFPNVQAGKVYIEDWLTKKCGMDCYCGEAAAQMLGEKHGGALPETAFSCPEVLEAPDLQQYSGFYHYGSLGSFHIFVTAIYDGASAKRFKNGAVQEFKLDQIFSEEADDMIDMLEILERSFTEDVNYAQALEKVDRLIRQNGLMGF